MKRLLMTLVLLLTAGAVVAQSGKVTAKVIDKETKDGVIGAIVEVVSVKNPNVRKHTTTGAGGAVSIGSLSAGSYEVSISFIGYATAKQTVTVKGVTDLGTVELAPEAVAIEAVVKEVQALRTSQNGDTVAYNAAAFKVAADADVEGLLKKMPGITITNGTVEAQGEQVKKIFVDGKEFFAEDVSTALNSLPAQAVDRVEVFNKLSDNAEFSGMDDGEGYKAINIVTQANMRQGVFGKLYAGVGYQPKRDEVTQKVKYNAGGNVNYFHESSRLSIIGLWNNVNQQNFSFEDILGVTGGGGGMGGGRGRGVGQYMVRPQSGVARVGSIGVQYSDSWGENDKLKLNGSYFFNSTRTKNRSVLEKWYTAPSPADTLVQSGYSNTLNMNHRLNLRLDWAINRNMSIMSRTNFSFQGNNPYSFSEGVQYGESGYNIMKDYSTGESKAFRISEFLQYRVKLGKPGRTITVDGNVRYRVTPTAETDSYSTLSTLYDPEQGIYYPDLRCVKSFAPVKDFVTRANFTYTEPISKSSQLSAQYRFEYNDQQIDKLAYLTLSDFDITGLTPDASLSKLTSSQYFEHKVGPGYRYAKKKNNIVANVFYQCSSLNGMVDGKEIKRKFDNVTYFVMGNFAFNAQNTLRMFVSSWTENPDVRNLQDIYDVSNAQFITKGNPDLRPAYSHNIRAHYVRSNIEKGRTFMLMFMAQFTQDYIGQSVDFNPGEMTIDEVAYNPLQYMTYANLDGYRSLRSHLSYGFPISPIKCNLNLMAGVNWTRTPSLINGETNMTSNMGYDAMFTLGSNISENIDFTIQWNGTFNDAKQSLAANGGKNQYFNHTASANLKWVFWKGFSITAAVNYNQYVGFTNDYNEDYLICNVYLGKKLFKNQLGEVLIGVNDLLNQNTAFARTVGSGYTQNSWNSVVGRYFTVQFTYNLRYFGKNATKDISKYEGMDIKPGMGGFGRPPMRH
ncbi:MAG: outer membrane beta-barrel protein [Alistipes sp.]|nr:outer membrane beta-barrel protein [Alistipes sp.]